MLRMKLAIKKNISIYQGMLTDYCDSLALQTKNFNLLLYPLLSFFIILLLNY